MNFDGDSSGHYSESAKSEPVGGAGGVEGEAEGEGIRSKI